MNRFMPLDNAKEFREVRALYEYAYEATQKLDRICNDFRDSGLSF